MTDVQRLPHAVVVVQTGFLGDAVLATGMLRSLHAAGIPEIGFVVRAEVAAIFEGHPAITRLHVLDKRSSGATAAMTEELRACGYEAALVPHRSMRSALMVRRASIARRIGFRQAELAWLHSDGVHYSIAQHELDRNAGLVERLGIDAAARGSWLHAQPAALDTMRPHAGAVVVAPGSVWATKRWNAEGFIEVVRELGRGGERVLLVGSADDRALCQEIGDGASSAEAPSPSPTVLAGEISLPELVALCALASRVIANDSAPLHIAEAVGTPVTAIFGPTVPGFGFGPVLDGSAALGVELPCRPCRIHGGDRCPIGTHECMHRVTPADVLATIGRWNNPA